MLEGQITLQDILQILGSNISEALIGDIRYIIEHAEQFKPDAVLTEEQAEELGYRLIGAIWQLEKIGYTLYSLTIAIKQFIGAKMGSNISKSNIDAILKTPKGSRPDPSTYLSPEYIENHLAKFKNGVTKIYTKPPRGAAGPEGGTFVMPSSIADKLIAQAGGDISKLEQSLGLPQSSLGTNPIRIDVLHPTGLRMPSGNELGTNPQWIPGGYTSGGIPEAVINSPALGEYIIHPIK